MSGRDKRVAPCKSVFQLRSQLSGSLREARTLKALTHAGTLYGSSLWGSPMTLSRSCVCLCVTLYRTDALCVRHTASQSAFLSCDVSLTLSHASRRPVSFQCDFTLRALYLGPCLSIG